MLSRRLACSFLAVMFPLALSACGSNEADEAATGPVAVPSQTAAQAAVAEMAGTYEVTLTDDRTIMQTLAPDGTYVDRVDGEVTERGAWRQQGNQLCFDPDGGDSTEQCYAGGDPGPDGAFEMRDDTGAITATVRKAESQPTA